MEKNKVDLFAIHSVVYWLIVQKWLWKKVIFDNGIVGKKYHRYDHIILPFVQGMGDNGYDGDVNTAIRCQLCQMFRDYLKSVNYDK